MKTLKNMTCPSCGAKDFTSLKNGLLKCKYCGSMLEQEQEQVQQYNNETISGNMQNIKLVYIVHKNLIVKGNMNDITKIGKLRSLITRNSIHVNVLEIKGNMNNIKVILMPTATYSNNGNMNSFH